MAKLNSLYWVAVGSYIYNSTHLILVHRHIRLPCCYSARCYSRTDFGVCPCCGYRAAGEPFGACPCNSYSATTGSLSAHVHAVRSYRGAADYLTVYSLVAHEFFMSKPATTLTIS